MLDFKHIKLGEIEELSRVLLAGFCVVVGEGGCFQEVDWILDLQQVL